MARPSKLTEKQWQVVIERAVAGEPVRAIARELKISESTIRERVSAQVKQIKDVANQIVNTDLALKKMPVSAQITAHNLADMIKAMQLNLVISAANGASVAAKLSRIALNQANRVDDDSIIDSENAESIKGIAILTRTANEASQSAMDLMKLNKEAAADLGKTKESANKNLIVSFVDSNK